MTETVERLKKENQDLIVKCMETINRELNAKRDIDVLRRIIRSQAVKIDQFKPVFWRFYWK